MPQNLRISELTDGGNVRVVTMFPANRGGQTLRMLYSGGGLVFRNPADEFVGATLAACRTARSTYFTTTSTTAFQDFIANRFLAIVLNPTNSTDNVLKHIPDRAARTTTLCGWNVLGRRRESRETLGRRRVFPYSVTSIPQPRPQSRRPAERLFRVPTHSHCPRVTRPCRQPLPPVQKHML